MTHQVNALPFSDRDADALLTGLVERYSPSREEGPATSYLVEQMHAQGLRAYRDAAGNAVGELGEGERTILLLGHIDTVRGPIEVRREGNLLFGRGTVDAKGPLAAFVGSLIGGALPGFWSRVLGLSLDQPASYRYTLLVAVALLAPSVVPLFVARDTAPLQGPAGSTRKHDSCSKRGWAPRFGLARRPPQSSGRSPSRVLIRLFLSGRAAREPWGTRKAADSAGGSAYRPAINAWCSGSAAG